MRAISLLPTLVLFVGCGSSTPAPTSPPGSDAEDVAAVAVAEPEPIGAPLSVNGVVKGAAPEGAQLALLWLVTTGEDRAYHFGTGTLEGTGFVLQVPGTGPPAGAINDATDIGLGRFAVGIPVLLAPGTNLEQGPVTDNDVIEKAIVGLASRHAIIWRDGSFPKGSKVDWPGAFDAGGFTCGVCEDREEGFDGYVPTECGTVEIQVAPVDELDVCNWT